MPGQALNGDEIQPDRVVWVERISDAVRIVRRHGTSYRRLDFIGSDGHTKRFIVQTGQHWSGTGGASDERMMQLLRQMNRLLDRFPEARRRNLAFHTPIIVPVWPQVRLLEEDASYCSYGEAYEVNCARYGREPDTPIISFKRAICNDKGDLIADPDGQLRLQAYKKIVEDGVVMENVFSQFMYKALPSAAHLWIFKKQFCAQLALSGLVSHMLLLGGRNPTKILFARSSGKLFQMEFVPSYDQRGLLERTEPVPFRLTRNLQTFFTPFGVDGIFITSMALAAQACLAPHSNLQHLLSMFFRDDITAWALKRTRMMGPGSSGVASSASGLRPSQLRGVVVRNIDDCFARLKIIAPTTPPPRNEEAVVGVAAVKGLQQGAVQLVEAALDPRLLCKMDPTWHPWL